MKPIMIDRRRFMAQGFLGSLGLALAGHPGHLLASGSAEPKAKSCILLWLSGGPSHIDTFDPKTHADIKGSFNSIETKTPGLRFSEHLPKLAQRSDKLTAIRSMTSKEGDHERAYELMHSGAMPQAGAEFPSLGSVMSWKWNDAAGELPKFVSIGYGYAPLRPGFLGMEHSPYQLDSAGDSLANVALPEGIDKGRHDRRLAALEAFDQSFVQRNNSSLAADHGRFRSKARRLMNSPDLAVFDLSKEKEETLKRYGATGEEAEFGKGCLLASRLVTKGVRFVEVSLGDWDTHEDNFTTTKDVSRQLDVAMSALLDDLHASGAIKDTIVLCMGEFGRSPEISENNGREHWSDAFSMLAAGAGIASGAVIGSTDEKGAKVKDRPVTAADLHATVLSLLGVDIAHEHMTPEGRPVRLADQGKVIKELLS